MGRKDIVEEDEWKERKDIKQESGRKKHLVGWKTNKTTVKRHKGRKHKEKSPGRKEDERKDREKT